MNGLDRKTAYKNEYLKSKEASQSKILNYLPFPGISLNFVPAIILKQIPNKKHSQMPHCQVFKV